MISCVCWDKRGHHSYVAYVSLTAEFIHLTSMMFLSFTSYYQAALGLDPDILSSFQAYAGLWIRIEEKNPKSCI